MTLISGGWQWRLLFPFVDCVRAGKAITRQFEKDIMRIIENGGGQCKKTTLTVAASPRKFMRGGWLWWVLFPGLHEGWQCRNQNCNVEKDINRIIRCAGEIAPKEWWVKDKKKRNIDTTAFSIKLTGRDGGGRPLFPSLTEGGQPAQLVGSNLI